MPCGLRSQPAAAGRGEGASEVCSGTVAVKRELDSGVARQETICARVMWCFAGRWVRRLRTGQPGFSGVGEGSMKPKVGVSCEGLKVDIGSSLDPLRWKN